MKNLYYCFHPLAFFTLFLWLCLLKVKFSPMGVNAALIHSQLKFPGIITVCELNLFCKLSRKLEPGKYCVNKCFYELFYITEAEPGW